MKEELERESIEMSLKQRTGDRKFYQFVNVFPIHEQQHAQQLARMREAMTHPRE